MGYVRNAGGNISHSIRRIDVCDENYYALTVCANKRMSDGSTLTRIVAGGVWAHSDEEASSRALALAESEWPLEDGWYNHSGTYCLLSFVNLVSPNPWRELWQWVLADTHFPWVWDTMAGETICTFCGHGRPGHHSVCPYVRAQALKRRSG